MRKHFPDCGSRCEAAARTGKTLVKARLEPTAHQRSEAQEGGLFPTKPVCSSSQSFCVRNVFDV